MALPAVLPSPTELELLRLISRHGESYGLSLVELSRGAITRGTMYVTLQRMEAKGLVRSRLEPPHKSRVASPRRLYTLTDYGARAMHALVHGFDVADLPTLNGAESLAAHLRAQIDRMESSDDVPEHHAAFVRSLRAALDRFDDKQAKQCLPRSPELLLTMGLRIMAAR